MSFGGGCVLICNHLSHLESLAQIPGVESFLNTLLIERCACCCWHASICTSTALPCCG